MANADIDANALVIDGHRRDCGACQLECVACGYICPTAAIRPLTLAEKIGKGKFAGIGPIKLGTAFVDRARCLPWAFDTPCIVCQENCPVSPKAIYTREVFAPVVFNPLNVKNFRNDVIIILSEPALIADKFSNGDYYCQYVENGKSTRKKIISNTADTLKVPPDALLNSSYSYGPDIQIQIRLLQPYIDPALCIGCGICQHECPVSGRGAVFVTPAGQTREK